MKSSNPSPYFSRSGSNVGDVTIVVQNRDLRLVRIPRPHRRINLPDIRKIMQQHRQRDLAHKARPADEEDLLALKYFCW